MLRSAKLIGLLTICAFVGTFRTADADEDGQATDLKPFVIGNREEPTEDQLLVIAKSFCVAMRRNHNLASVPGLRSYFDPRYLEKHGLLEGEFKLHMASVGAIYNIQVAEDKNTILCHLETANGQKEAILLRTITLDRKLYLMPLKSPDEETGMVTPWILRMKL